MNNLDIMQADSDFNSEMFHVCHESLDRNKCECICEVMNSRSFFIHVLIFCNVLYASLNYPTSAAPNKCRGHVLHTIHIHYTHVVFRDISTQC